MLLPKRVKHRKQQRGRMAGTAKGSTTVDFGQFGLKALQCGWVNNRQIEAARIAMTRHIKRGGKVWINVFPHKPITKKAAETAAVKPARKVSAAKTKAKAERKAPEKVPGRKERRGIVVSDAMDKTIVVRIDVAQKHERYGKVVRRSSKLHAHDEQNAAGVGDLVRVVETRPLSAMKRWRLLEDLEKAPPPV